MKCPVCNWDYLLFTPRPKLGERIICPDCKSVLRYYSRIKYFRLLISISAVFSFSVALYFNNTHLEWVAVFVILTVNGLLGFAFFRSERLDLDIENEAFR